MEGMTDHSETLLADIRTRNEERKAAEQEGVIGGARANFDVDFLLRYIDKLTAEPREGNQ